MRVVEIEAKSILVRSKLPDADFVLNPYTGCAFSCRYCYASFMGRFVNEPISEWGEYVYVKVNACCVFAKELSRLTGPRRHAKLLLSSVTDPYQGLEKKYQLTRGLLEILVKNQFSGKVSILTKSPMVMRDVDLIAKLSNAEVGITVTTTDDSLSRWLEVSAPKTSRRIDTLKRLSHAGIPTYAFIGPLLPHFRYSPELLEELIRALSEAGISSAFVEHINLSRYIQTRMKGILDDASPEVRETYRSASTSGHRKALDAMVRKLLDKYDIELRLADVIYHKT